MEEKAYKLLAVAKGITNRSAKDLIDRGLVYAGGKKIIMARAMLDSKTNFKVNPIEKIKKLYEDSKILAIDKPAFITSEEISKKFKTPLLHRLDRETSGVLLLVKDEIYQKKAIQAFKNLEVIKEYRAWVSGIVSEKITIDSPIFTIKKGGSAYSKISKDGKKALSIVKPLEVSGKFSKVQVDIKSGRTHQIRTHLKSISHPIVGDLKYGGKKAKRMLLHSTKIALLGKTYESPEPIGFELTL
jgi:23S rRNA pseudouridine1911/1915/1917 synthase